MEKTGVSILGCGSIGTFIAKRIDMNSGFILEHVFDSDKDKAEKLAGNLRRIPKVADHVEDMFSSDIIVECASRQALEQYGLFIIEKCDMLVMSVSAFSDINFFNKMKETAEKSGKRIYVPSGAIAGLDAVKASSVEDLSSVTLTTRKSPRSLEGAPYIEKKGISLKSIRKPTVIFEGSAKEAADAFPQNVNVSISLSLAGLGPEKTKVRIIADPLASMNTHEITAKGKSGRITTLTENVPSHENPKTSQLAALSAVRTLEKIRESVVIGT